MYFNYTITLKFKCFYIKDFLAFFLNVGTKYILKIIMLNLVYIDSNNKYMKIRKNLLQNTVLSDSITIKILRRKNMVKGKRNKDYYEFSDSIDNINLLEIAKILQNLEYPQIYCSYDKDINELLYKGRIPFLDNNFKLNDIPFISLSTLQNIDKMCIYKKLDFKDFMNIINNNLNIIHPFEIPVTLDDTLGIEGGYCNPVFLGKIDNITNIVFTEFIISKKMSVLTPGIYAHEIVHSQLEYNNSVKNYVHSEVLPIFFDMLTALYMNDNYETLRINEQKRLLRLYNTIINYNNKVLMPYKKIKLLMGIISILEAEQLFDKFFYSNNNDKSEIIFKINNVLAGNLFVEDLLEEKNIFINNQNSKNIIKSKRLNLL